MNYVIEKLNLNNVEFYARVNALAWKQSYKGIVDNDSKNKTYVNGEQLKPGDTPKILSPGDKIQLADEELEFCISQ